MKFILTVLMVLCLASVAMGNDFNKGLEAYNKGDYATAVTYFEKACNEGKVKGCFNLGIMYKNGNGVKQDYFKAVELYEKACNGGDASGCLILGLMYYFGDGVRLNKRTALEYYGKACDMKLQDGCEAYAIMKKELGL